MPTRAAVATLVVRVLTFMEHSFGSGLDGLRGCRLPVGTGWIPLYGHIVGRRVGNVRERM
jgi:hypothetical protein